MAYNAGIPNATDRISDSQAPIKANFTAIDTMLKVNHVEFDAASGKQGKHNFVSLPEQVANPATVADEVSLFSKDSAYNVGTTVLSYKNEAGSVYEVGAPGTSWAVLPSGLIMKWGTNTFVLVTRDQSFVIPSTGTAGPAFTTLYNINFTIFNNSSSDENQCVK